MIRLFARPARSAAVPKAAQWHINRPVFAATQNRLYSVEGRIHSIISTMSSNQSGSGRAGNEELKASGLFDVSHVTALVTGEYFHIDTRGL